MFFLLIRGDQTINDKKGDKVFLIFKGFHKNTFVEQINQIFKDSIELTIQATSPIAFTDEESYLIGNEQLKNKIIASDNHHVVT